MKPRAVVSDAGSEALVGRVVCHDVLDETGRVIVRKGRVVDRTAASLLAGLGRREIHLLEIEPGDLHEVAAGARLAAVVAAGGVRVRDSSGGQLALASERRGLLRVRVEALQTVNALEGISVYTLFDGQVVDAGEVVAKAKVTPLVIREAIVSQAEARCREAGGLVAVLGFQPMTVSAVAPASLEARTRERFAAALQEKLAWLGARLGDLAYVEADRDAVAGAIRTGLAHGADLVVVAGANALDPLDPIFLALDRLKARPVRRGVPAHPGSLLWIADLGGIPVVGMPSCGMFSQATLFDLLLPRFLAGEVVGTADLAALGHGGLLGREMAYRFPPYRAGHDRGTLPG